MAFVQEDTENVSRSFLIFFFCLNRFTLFNTAISLDESTTPPSLSVPVFLVSPSKTIDYIDNVPVFMEYMFLRFESKISET